MASVGVAPTFDLRESGSHDVAVDRLREEINDMKIMDDKEMEATIVNGNGTETGHIIVTMHVMRPYNYGTSPSYRNSLSH